VRWLQEKGIDARAVQTRFEGERDDEVVEGVEEEMAGQRGGRAGALLADGQQESLRL
jgi:hypothetical protein